MARNRYLLSDQERPGYLPLYEGSTITAFDFRGGGIRHWIEPASLPSARREAGFRVALRTLGPSRHGRLLVAALLPPHAIAASSVIVSSSMDAALACYAIALLNSFVLDFVAQRQATGMTRLHIPLRLVSTLPLREPAAERDAVVERAGRLLWQRGDLGDMAMQLGYGGTWGELPLAERNRIRAELEALIARSYDLTEDDLAVVLSTFPKVPEPERLAARNARRDLDRGLIS